MSFERVVGTLVHESLHGWCRVRGKCMPTEREHICMARLGDFCYGDENTTVTIRNVSAALTMTVSYLDGGDWQVDSIMPRGGTWSDILPAGTVRAHARARAQGDPPQRIISKLPASCWLADIDKPAPRRSCACGQP